MSVKYFAVKVSVMKVWKTINVNVLLCANIEGIES
jgi:hypothetical protein